MTTLDQRFLTKKELGAILRRSLGAIDDLIAKRQIEHVKVGQRVLFSERAIEEYLRRATRPVQQLE